MLLFLYACCMVAAQDDGDGGVVSLALESIRALLPSHSFLFGSKLAENYRLPANHYGQIMSNRLLQCLTGWRRGNSNRCVTTAHTPEKFLQKINGGFLPNLLLLLHNRTHVQSCKDRRIFSRICLRISADVVSKSFTYFILHSLCSNFLKNFYSIPNVHVFLLFFFILYMYFCIYTVLQCDLPPLRTREGGLEAGTI